MRWPRLTYNVPVPPPEPSMSNSPNTRLRELEADNVQLREALDQRIKYDADKLKEALDKLSEREHDLQSILDNMPSMIGYWDKNQRNRFGNHAYYDWFGIDPAGMPGKHMREVIGEERYRLNRPYIEAALRGTPQLFERAIPTPDGKRIRYSLAHYIPDLVDGQVRGMYVLVNDITTIKETQAALAESEARLRESEEHYRAVVEDQTDAIARFRADGVMLFANRAFCSLFGKAAAELVGHHFLPLCFSDDQTRFDPELLALSPGKPVAVIESQVHSADGKLHWMQFINHGFFDADGNLTEFQCVGRDITEIKQADAALREVLNQLEKRVLDRTEEVRRLAVEATLAEERERQAIARDLHDDIGQRLHVIRLKLDTIARKQPGIGDDIAELRTLVTEASGTVRSLTSQLSPPVLRKLGIAAALHWLADEMARQYGLTVAFEPGEVHARLSQAQSSILFRAARELLINVVKHSGAHLARLDLTQADGTLVLSVEDAGTGMDEMGDIPIATNGFGLASIRERMAFLGGRVEIARPPAGGLRVTLTLPLKPAKPTRKGAEK